MLQFSLDHELVTSLTKAELFHIDPVAVGKYNAKNKIMPRIVSDSVTE